VADHGLTGILLVGGASRRFGSPKALARFRDETLAERAWRLLGDMCDERIAVGKEVDGLDLPFPVVDDGAEEQAPVYGLVAGLRAAANDLALVVPVDCPLLTADSLRALAAARAVPQTGPLPGAYEKDLVPELEARLARGELTLRGVNPRPLELDERELLNVNTRMDLVAAAIADWAIERADVHAVAVVGSQARTEAPADRWSDLEVLLVVDDPEPYFRDEGWVSEFGDPLLTFVGPTAIGGERERRVLYRTGEDVDLSLLSPGALAGLEEDEEVAQLLRRGYRVLLDEIGIEARLHQAAASAPTARAPAPRDFEELSRKFWYHALWAAKKLRRGEVFIAKQCVDGYLKSLLAALLARHARSVDPTLDTWHGGRFLERWGDPGALAALESAYATYDVRDVARALWQTIDLWSGLEDETARRLRLELVVDQPELRRLVAEVVPDPRRNYPLGP